MTLLTDLGLPAAARFGARGMRHFARRVRARLAPPALVLMYHRVAEVPVDPWGLCVSPRHFATQLAVLKRTCTPMALSKMVQLVREGRRLPRRAVAITFDDGYADNLWQAQRLLAEHDLPATFFIATGLLGKDREFWWDELEGILLQSHSLPAVLDLEVAGQSYSWRVAGAKAGGGEAAWRAWQEPPSERHALYGALWKLLHETPPEERESVLSVLRAWAGTSSRARQTHRLLSEEELGMLAAKPGVEVGAHTVSHGALPFLTREVQRQEIGRSKACLEALVRRPVRGFSYPNGLCSDETMRLVREEGFGWACTVGNEPWTTPVAGRRSTSPFALPRLQVMNEGEDAFRRQLRAWWGAPA